MADTQIKTSELNVTKLKAPNKFNVIMLNDDITPMDFVIAILVNIFNKQQDSAKNIMLEIHEKGRSIVGTYSYEVAEQKCVECIQEARNAGFPLDVLIEET
jgi:ATP-dependent Clp protease adaptor protein ClpS